MKKLMWTIYLLVVSVTTQAQFERGKWIVNPSMTGLGPSYSRSEKTRFGLQAQGGALLANNMTLMLMARANRNKPEDKYTLGVGGRYYFDKCGIYLGIGLKMNRYNRKVGDTIDSALGMEAGYALFLVRVVTIEPATYYDLSFKGSDLSKFGLKVSFGFYF